MAVSRPFLLALIGIALLGATVFAVRNSQDQAADPAPTAQQGGADGSAASPEPAAQLTPEQTIKAALSPELDSARFDVKVSVKAGAQSGSFRMSGAADGSAAGPEFDVNVDVSGAGQDVSGGFVATGGKAWLVRDEVGYQVPPKTWSAALAQISQGQAAGQAAPLQQLPFDPSTWVKDVKSEGSETIDGVETEHVSAELNAAAAVRDIVKAAEAQAGQSQGATLPPGALAQVEKSLKRADFDVYVGKQDSILRRMTAGVVLAVPGSGQANVDFEVNVSDVNEPQVIEAPDKVSKALPRGDFGRFAQGFYSGLSLTTGTDVGALGAAPATNGHRRAERAVAGNRTVVLFFQNPRGLDDRATAISVRALQRNAKNVVVIRDDVRNVDRYGSLIEDLAVNQAPSVVVIDRGGSATLVEGYVDAQTLAQVVADAR